MGELPRYYLGGDLGGTRTRIVIADADGKAVGYGESGPGNHEGVGYDGQARNVRKAFDMAIKMAGISPEQIAGAGLGVAGYDWPDERIPTLESLKVLQLQAPLEIVNDTILGLLAGSESGWGVAIVSGTGCNCWGWDESRTHVGQVTGGGIMMGEGAGATELVFKAMQAVAQAWTSRGPATDLSDAFVRHVGARHVQHLLEGLMDGTFDINGSAAPLVFQMADAGDYVAREVVVWAGRELGELAKAVIRQLSFQTIEFELVLIGSMAQNGNALLRESLRETVLDFAPGARIVHLDMPPVVGAILLGMKQAGLNPDRGVKQKLAETLALIDGRN
jgi:N-acetylglucosamine kinase-like BadF-type ATPase